MGKNRSVLPSRNSPIFFALILLVISALMISIWNLMNRSAGIGSLTNMKTFGDERMGFSIKYPEEWNAFSTPQGSHGDQDVIAVILAPGKSFPQVYIARGIFGSEEIAGVEAWGASRAKKRSSSIEISNVEKSPGNVEETTREYSWQEETYLGPAYIRCEDLYRYGAMSVTTCLSAPSRRIGNSLSR